MDFLLSTVGSAGDVFPMVGLALTLLQRGHSVTLATNPYFAPLAEKHGIPFEPLGTVEQYQECTQNPALWEPRTAFKHIFSYFQSVLKEQYQLYLDRARQRPYVGLSSCLGFGSRMVQETHQIPVLTIHLQPAVVWSDEAPPTLPGMFGPRWLRNLQFRIGEKYFADAVVAPFLNPWRKQLGLPPVKRLVRWWNSPMGVICMFPDWYAAPQTDWPQPLIQTDFPLWNDASNEPLTEKLSRFLDGDDPPIVFTPGTANRHGSRFFAAAADTCRQLKKRGIFLTKYLEQIPDSLPDTLLHVNYAPLDRVLPRAAAFVHHGGVGSTSQAFLAGIPQVIMPRAHDQFDNAARVKKLGVGIGLPVRQFTSPRLQHALQELLSSPRVAPACREIQQRVIGRTGLARTAVAIEDRIKTLGMA